MMKKIILTAAIFGFLTFSANNISAQVSQADLDLRNAFKKSYESELAVKYAKAIEDLAPFANNNTYEINLRLGYLNYMNAKFLQATTHYKKCLELAPKSVEARLAYINALAALEKWDDVILQYKEILKVDAGNAKALYNLSLIYFNRTDYTTAQIYLNTYIALYPFDFDGVNLAGWNKYYLGKKEEAIVLFKKALLLNPSSTLYDSVLVNKK
jgi:tetratricopeptide (TPR) repeat protein